MTPNLTEHWIEGARMLKAKKSPHPEHDWAFDWFLHNLDKDTDEVFRQIVEIAAATNDEGVLGLLGAGPLENLIDRTGFAYLEKIEKAAANSEGFAIALSAVWKGDIPTDVWQALENVKRRVAT
jgi:hypothetical protein